MTESVSKKTGPKSVDRDGGMLHTGRTDSKVCKTGSRTAWVGSLGAAPFFFEIGVQLSESGLKD